MGPEDGRHTFCAYGAEGNSTNSWSVAASSRVTRNYLIGVVSSGAMKVFDELLTRASEFVDLDDPPKVIRGSKSK